MKDVTVDEFKSFVESDKPTFVLFSADWCAPCKQLTPILDRLSKEKGFDVVKVKVSKDTLELVTAHKVSSIPHLVSFKDGQEKASMIGFAGEASVTEFINKNL